MTEYGGNWLNTRLAQLPQKHQVLVCSCATTRLFPIFRRLAKDDPEVRLDLAENALKLIWRWLEDDTCDRADLLAILEQISKFLPEGSITPAEFAVGCAEDFVGALAAVVNVLLDAKNSGGNSALRLAIDSVWQFAIENQPEEILVIESPKLREPDIWKDDHIQNELTRQLRDIGDVEQAFGNGEVLDVSIFRQRAESEDAFDLASFSWPM